MGLVMKKWRVVVVCGKEEWEHLNSSEEDAANIVASCPPDYFAYMLPMCMFDEWGK